MPYATATQPGPRLAFGRSAATWLRAEGTAVSVGAADVAVILQPATVDQLLRTVATCHRLTARESQILGFLTHGLAGKQIARRVGISVYTVNEHLGSLYRKCDVSGREQLIGRLT